MLTKYSASRQDTFQVLRPVHQFCKKKSKFTKFGFFLNDFVVHYARPRSKIVIPNILRRDLFKWDIYGENPY